VNARDTTQTIALKTGRLAETFIFHPETVARGKELGLDGFRFYFLGRGGVLGDVDAAVVHSAFGYFSPDLIGKMWTSAKERLDPRQAAREYIACAHNHGRARLGGVAGLDAYVEAAGAVIAAADDSALTLFAGLRAEPVPGDAPAAAFHQAMVLRELRGSAHLVAVTAVGLPSLVAHMIKRPNDVATFGWPDDAHTLTDDDRERHARAEEITDSMLEAPYSVLSADQGAALIAGVEAMHAALSA
jgi:hypothetical protein